MNNSEVDFFYFEARTNRYDETEDGGRGNKGKNQVLLQLFWLAA